jgi:peroxiredoxin
VWISVTVATVALIGHALLTPTSAAGGTTPGVASTPLPPAGAVGHLAPDVTLLNLANHPVALSSYHGQVVVLNFWYVACEPCRYEMPIFERVYHTERAQGVVVIGLNITDDSATIADFTHTLGIDYPILRDSAQRAVLSYAITATPTTFVIDRQGVIRARFAGAITDSQALTSMLAPLISRH